MNRTLLREEGDEELENRQEKKKRDKEKFQDADKKKRVASKKIDGKKDVYHNAAVSGILKVQPVPGMVETAAVNPDAEGLTSPVDTPAVTQAVSPGAIGYQGGIVIPPPPRPVTLQQIANQQQVRGNWPQQPHVVYVTPHPHQVQLHSQVLPPQYISTPGPPSQQVEGQFVPRPHKQGHFAVPQYGHVMAGSVQRAPAPPHAAVMRTHSLPSQACTPGDHAAGTQPVWSPQSSASTLPFNSMESTLASSSVETSDGRSWRDSTKPIHNSKRNDAFSVNSGHWTAFSPIETTLENAWMDEVDEEHSSSDEDVERSSSPELMGEEGEVLLRAPSLASFAESISSLEEETEDIVWRILPEQREYYTKQFRRLQPAETGVVKGHKARDFFMKSSLPPEILSKIWHLSDIDKDNALNLDEFCIAMHLVVALRHGLELPSTLPGVLLHTRKEAEVAQTVIQPPQTDPNTPLQSAEDEDQEPRKAVSPEHSVAQPTPMRAQDHYQADDIARQPSLSDPPSLEDAADRVPVGKAPDVPQGVPTSPNQSVTAEIARPRATVKPSLLDALPGQLLPPPSSKQAREGWTPTSKIIYQALSRQTEVQSPEHLSSPLSSPTPEATPDSPLSSDEERKTPSPPLKVQEEEAVEALTEELHGEEEVVHRQNKRSGERPRSTGDVKSPPPLDSSSSSTPLDEGSQGSASSEGRREPPPPPPRNKKGHSRSSSLDLNKLFAAKAKESRGSPTSSPSSSHSSQNGDVMPAAKSEPTTPRHGTETPSDASAVVQEDGKFQKQEDFADFSVFNEFVEARESAAETAERKDSLSRCRNHRRSFSLDHGRDTVSSHPPQAAPIEVTSRATQNHEALPRPVPKLKPPSPPTLKQGRKPDKDGEKERKLKTEPPKVVVRPLTKEDKLNARIVDLKERNVTLSRVNSELQQELKTVMERRVSLEVKLERLRSSSSQ